MANSTVTLPQDCSVPEWLAYCLQLRKDSSLNGHGDGNGHIPVNNNGHRLETAIVPSPEDHKSPLSLDDAGCALVSQAFQFAYKLHEGQKRASGEAYICHP
ncbi:MAG: hypothetical protein AAF622_11425, partial [Cyanobacteria bacterium P01_C01_bin.147]